MAAKGKVIGIDANYDSTVADADASSGKHMTLSDEKAIQLEMSKKGVVASTDFSRRAVPYAVIPEPIFSRFMTIPPVGERYIHMAARHEAEDVVPFSIEEVHWMFHTLPPTDDVLRYERDRSGIPKGARDMCILALRSKFMEKYYEHYSQMGVKPRLITRMDAINSVVEFPEKYSDIVVHVAKSYGADIPGNGTVIVIRDSQGRYRTRGLTLGEADIKWFDSRVKAGERASNPKERKELLENIRRSMAQQICCTAKFFKSEVGKVDFRNCYVIGDDTEMGTTDELVRALGDAMHETDGALRKIEISNDYPGSRMLGDIPVPRGMEMACGAALYGMGEHSDEYLRPGDEELPVDIDIGEAWRDLRYGIRRGLVRVIDGVLATRR